MEKIINPYYKNYHNSIAFKINEIIDEIRDIKKRLDVLEQKDD